MTTDRQDQPWAEYLDKATAALSGNPSIRLLRNPHALFILTFLYATFKETQEPAIEAELLGGRLAQFLEEGGLPDEAMPSLKGSAEHRAGVLLDHWCREDNKFLRRFADEDGTVLVELTPFTERVFQWVEALGETEMVGTESRFGEILRRLDELLDHSNPDPQAAIKRLEERKKALDEEIRRIRDTGIVKQFSDLQIEERFKSLNRLSRELLGDFKQVEANFKAIVKEIYARQSDKDFSRGDILGYTMDATEQLRQSPQGQSFYAFWEFLIQDTGKETLRTKVEDLWVRLQERQLPQKDEVLRNLKTYLHQAGKKVIASNHLLAEKLNRLLTERERRRREKTVSLLRDIKDGALKIKLAPAEDEVFWTVEGAPEVSMIMERPLSDPPRRTDYAKKPERQKDGPPEDSLAELAGQFYIDTAKLKQRIDGLVRTRPVVELLELLQAFPPEQGLSEIMAYIALASQSPSGEIDPSDTVDISIDQKRLLQAPRVVFKHD